MSKTMNTCVSPRRVVIIGGGIGGLTCAIRLKTKLGFENFTIYEKASDIGGTWRDNTYPGCGSDVQIHYYSLSTDLNPNWERSHGSQVEIQAYWKGLAQKYGILPHAVFNTKVLSAEWDTTKQVYHITIQDIFSKNISVTAAEIVVSAIGILEDPRYPADLASISDYKGEIFHSARWNHDLDLHDKRVAVIGNGCSATQFVPIITEDPTVNVTQFSRSPSWYLPGIKTPYSATLKWIFANVPGVMRFYRFSIFVRSEIAYIGFSGNRWITQRLSNTLKLYLLKMCPEEYRDDMTPKYPPGCKRLIIDAGYLSALSRPNLTPNFDGISKITNKGILTKNGKDMSFDVIIFATGFTVDKYPFPIRGINGTIQDYYAEHNGPTAYKGTAVPGFPNFYLLSGPNTVTGHASVIFSEEVQIDYILQMIEPIIAGAASSFEVTAEATDMYNDLIQRRASRTVYTQCVSWYRSGGDGKVSSIFPGPLTLLWWWLRSPIWKDYKVVGGEKLAKQRRWATIRNLGVVSFSVFVAWLLSKRYTLQTILRS